MKTPIGFRVMDNEAWIAPELNSDYSSVNNSFQLVGSGLFPKSIDLSAEASGFSYAWGLSGPNNTLHFIESEPFCAGLMFVGEGSTYNQFMFRDEERSNTLTMFRKEFMQLVQNPSYTGGRPIEGDWEFIIRYGQTGIRLIRAYA